MNKMNLTIITDSGPHIGQGHLQRMLLLSHYCSSTIANISLLHKSNTVLSKGFQEYIVESIPKHSDCILRDMRDSTEEEIKNLKKIAPVIVLDDCGKGRTLADVAIDLLPNIYGKTHNTFESDVPLFLYGYNFYKALLSSSEDITKDIDCFIYASTFDCTTLCNSINNDISFVCTDGKSIISNINYSTANNYTNLIARSKVVISHFGITIYEAMLCKCHCIILNPTVYHNELSRTLHHTKLKLYHEVYNPCNNSHIIQLLKNFVEEGYKHINTTQCIDTINTNLKNFVDVLRLIITG